MLKPGFLLILSILTTNALANQSPYELFNCDRTSNNMEDVLTKSHDPFHEEHLIKFLRCTDNEKVQCYEFATDKYLEFGKVEQYLNNFLEKTNSSPTINQACTPKREMDELIKNSIHANDISVSYIG